MSLTIFDFVAATAPNSTLMTIALHLYPNTELDFIRPSRKREGRARMVRYLITGLKEYAKYAVLEAAPWSAHYVEMKFMKARCLSALRERIPAF